MVRGIATAEVARTRMAKADATNFMYIAVCVSQNLANGEDSGSHSAVVRTQK